MAGKIKGLSREKLIAIFPRLADDPYFGMTSPASTVYNCMAWAYQMEGKWMCPKSRRLLCRPASDYYWPEGLEDSMDISTIVKMFEQKEYQTCQAWEHEDGYQKIALYIRPWTSKLGVGNDIQHSSPYLLEGHAYGEVYCIMKKMCD
jgi:hypothetical protein